MKKHFIINPAAGGGKQMMPLLDNIKSNYMDGGDVSFYVTREVGDATGYCRDIAADGEEHLFLVCGGDGTLGEVANGIVGLDNCTIALLPIGTGNDFVRNFYSTDEEKKLFLDIDAQFGGDDVYVDALEVIIDGEEKKYCVNVLNSGFDCEVAERMNSMRNNNVVPQKMKYVYSILEKFFKKPTLKARLLVDGEDLGDEERMLIAIGNGSFYGGGFKAAPLADLTDGVIDVCIIKNLSRLKFLTLVGSYKAGTHLEHPMAQDIITYKKCESVSLICEETQNVSFDGEIVPFNSLDVSILKSALRFRIPKKSIVEEFVAKSEESEEIEETAEAAEEKESREEVCV